MKLTKKLKDWAVAQKLAKADDTEAVFKTAISQAIIEEKLTAAQFAEMSATEKDDEASSTKGVLTQIADGFKDLKSLLEGNKGAATPPTPPAGDKSAVPPAGDKSAVPPAGDKVAPVGDKAAGGGNAPSGDKGVLSVDLEKMIMSASPAASLACLEGGEKSLSIRVKEAADHYSTTKSAAVFPQMVKGGRLHPNAGMPMKDWTDRQIDNPSDLDKAVSGAFAKFLCQTAVLGSKSAAFNTLPQHDKELLCYAMEKMAWGGTTDSNGPNGGYEDIVHRKLTLHEQKALIDDSTSGGLEAAPIVFDDQVITTPLLNGELYPQVKVVPIERGRRIEGVQVGNVTSSWGGVDDTAIALFNTAAFVTAFDTTIHRWEGAITIGRDFLSDTPIDFASIITGQYGERLLEDLDDVIAMGNGTTQPEGIAVKSGTTSVSFGGSTTLGGYESLRFGVAKAEHKAMERSAVFCGTETSYQRAKAIPVGAGDARRLSNTGNMPTYGDYSWMGVPYKINESLGNTKVFYAILGRYRMYRRRGLSMQRSIEGATLMRANEMLMIATARYGGQLERGAVAAVTSSAPA